MKKLLGIIIIGLIFVNNAYSNDPYSEENRKKSEIKISCKIEEIVNHYNQEDGRPTDLKNMFVTDVDLPSFIIETNSYEDEIWLNRVGIKAKKNFLPMQPGDVYQTYADTNHLFEAVNYKPSVDIDTGIGNFLSWYKKYYN